MTNKEAATWLREHIDSTPDGTKQSEAVQLAIEVLEASRWRNASEEFPDTEDDVLCVCNGYDSITYPEKYEIGCYKDDRWYMKTMKGHNPKILRWCYIFESDAE